MKRIGNIYEKITSVGNLRLADKKARKGKTHQSSIRKFDRQPDTNLLLLNESLINKTYRTSEYTVFKVYEPKERLVYRLPYTDRVAQHAVMNELEKMFVSTFTADTYSCVKGRGPHSASYALRRALRDREGTTYCLKLDIQKFYPNIDHTILKQLLRRKIKDGDMLGMLDEVIDSAPGVPIGNYLSQYFANFYLTYFDHWLKEQKGVKYYFRYCDDLVFLASNKPQLHQLLADIRQYLTEKLKLTIKGNYKVFPVEPCGIDFCGYVHYHDSVFMRKSIKKRLAKAVKIGYRPSVASYYGWAKHSNSKHLLKKLFMTKFSDLGIKPKSQALEGDKIDLYNILGQPITVHGYNVKPSKFEGKGNCLHMQIEFEGKKRVLFSGSGTLMDIIQQVPVESFPFDTTIIKENKRCLFT